MNAIDDHVYAIKKTYTSLSKGKYLLFFIPGFIIAIIYFIVTYRFSALQSSTNIAVESGWFGWLFEAINWLLSSIFSFIGVILEQIYIFILLTVLSPFFSALSEKIDSNITGRKYTFTFKDFIQDFFRMLLVVIIAISLEFAFLLVYWMLSWIPFVGIFDHIMYFLISAFFFGLAFYDYPLERDKVSVGATINFAFKNPLPILITGSIFLLLFNIPFIGPPISPVLTVMITTVVYLQMKKSKKANEKAI